MNRILVLGGGVGGTLVANLLAKKLRSRIALGVHQGPSSRRLRIARGAGTR